MISCRGPWPWPFDDPKILSFIIAISGSHHTQGAFGDTFRVLPCTAIKIALPNAVYACKVFPEGAQIIAK